MNRHDPIRFGRGELLSLLGLLAAGCLLRLPTLGAKSLWIDEVITAGVSESGFDSMIEYAKGDLHTPLSFIWTIGSMSLGSGETFVRLPAAVLGIVSLVVAFAVAKLVFSRNAGAVVATTLLVLSPFHIFHSQDARMYTGVITWSLMAWGAELLFWRRWSAGLAVRTWFLPLAVWAIATSANIYTSYNAFFFVAGQGLGVLWFLWTQRAHPRVWAAVVGWSAAVAVVAVSYFPWMGALLDFLQRSEGQAGLNFPQLWVVIIDIFERFGTQTIVGNSAFLVLSVVGVIVNRALAWRVLLFSFPALLYFTLVTPEHFIAVRYFSFLLAPYLFLVTAGAIASGGFILRRLPSVSSTSVAAAATIALVAVSWSPLARYFGTEKQNWRDASAFLAPQVGRDDRLLTGPYGAHFSTLYYIRNNHPDIAGAFLWPRAWTPERLRNALSTPGPVWYVHAYRPKQDPEFAGILASELTLAATFPALEESGVIYIWRRDE